MAFCAWCGNEVAAVSDAACARCGNPTNGAQRVRLALAGGSNSDRLAIRIVAGVVVLVVVVGILAAMIVPGMLTAMRRVRPQRTMAHIRAVATAVEAYGREKNELPRGTSVAELSSVLSPTYAPSTLPALDDWGTAMRYECWPKHGRCTSYAIGSAGADKAWQHESLQEYQTGFLPTVTTDPDADLVFTNGSFVQYPELVLKTR